MTDTDALDATTIDTLPYVRLLALLSESNRPPGGIDTVRRLVAVTHLRPGADVLHAGCSAGFLSRELARRSGCQVLGIDISPDMAASANARAREEGLDALVRHEVRDMRASQLPTTASTLCSLAAL
jgi:2-polyprenyl-3-methyl-5-hydroxy-6-metoxy-1,4-benzoquinol methylase